MARSFYQTSCLVFVDAKAAGPWVLIASRRFKPFASKLAIRKSFVVSQGVDSAVAAVLIHEAIGDQLTCIFVDHGLMRMDEGEEVVSLFRGHFNIPLVHVDAADLFIGQLEGEADPETKRKTIGRLFIEVFEAEAKNSAGLTS